MPPMTKRSGTWRAQAGDSRRRAVCSSAGVLGLLGSVACAASMLPVAAGVAGSAAASGMAAMTGTGTGQPAGARRAGADRTVAHGRFRNAGDRRFRARPPSEHGDPGRDQGGHRAPALLGMAGDSMAGCPPSRRALLLERMALRHRLASPHFLAC